MYNLVSSLLFSTITVPYFSFLYAFSFVHHVLSWPVFTKHISGLSDLIYLRCYLSVWIAIICLSIHLSIFDTILRAFLN